jgi:HAD superfamily hydrolase (TIGR01490 family)
MKLAIFDVDGTLTKISTEKLFINYLLKTKNISYFRLGFTLLLFAIKHKPLSISKLKSYKTYLKGFDAERIKNLAEECVNKEIFSNIRKDIVEVIEEKRKSGYKILLLSGSIDYLINHIAKFLNADYIIYAETEVKNGKLTGEILNEHPYGKNKKNLAERFCKEKGFNLKTASAFGNDYNDRFLLSEVFEPVAVYPDRKLFEFAKKNGWRIII